MFRAISRTLNRSIGGSKFETVSGRLGRLALRGRLPLYAQPLFIALEFIDPGHCYREFVKDTVYIERLGR